MKGWAGKEKEIKDLENKAREPWKEGRQERQTNWWIVGLMDEWRNRWSDVQQMNEWAEEQVYGQMQR